MQQNNTEAVCVSIILPVYNVEQWLRKCIESILAQTYRDFEIIAIDDGSTDSSASILDDYAEKHAQLRVIHQKNHGLSAARNVGIELSCGDYIMFLDSDDWIHTSMVEKLVEVAKSTGCKIVMCDYFECENGVTRYMDSFAPPVGPVRLNEYQFYCNYYNSHSSAYVSVWNKLYSRSVFEELRFKDGAVFEDSIILADTIHRSGEVAVINEPLYYYNLRYGSIMRSVQPPGAGLSSCEARLGRDARFLETGWTDLRVYNLANFCDCLATLCRRQEEMNEAELREYMYLRGCVLRMLCELAPHVLLRPKLAAHIVLFLAADAVYAPVVNGRKLLEKLFVKSEG